MKFSYQKIKQYYLAFAGYFYLYIVLGNIIGEILVRLGDNEKGVCYPYWGMFSTFSYLCKNVLYQYLWDITIGIPRFFIAITACSVYFLKISSVGLVNNFEYISKLETLIKMSIYDLKPLLEAGWWALISLPAIILIFIPGFLYWKKRYYYFALTIVLIHIAMIIHAGLD